MINLRCEYSILYDMIQFQLRMVGPDSRVTHLAKAIEWEASSPHADREPTVMLESPAARVLMDDLWRAGVRPSDTGTPGRLEAVKYHLEDMRKLVFEYEAEK